MTVEIRMSDYFGPFCADGLNALEFYDTKIRPIISSSQEIRVNFEGIRNMNSSFANALISNAVASQGESFLEKVKFYNCNANVEVHLRSALSIGLDRFDANGTEAVG